MSTEIAPSEPDGGVVSRFDSSLARERVAEQTLLRSVAKWIVIGIPIGVAFFIALLGLAIGDQLEWWAIIGLGTLLGVVAAVLFGMLGGVTLVAHVLEDVDRASDHHV
jgi:hypothetical protein